MEEGEGEVREGGEEVEGGGGGRLGSSFPSFSPFSSCTDGGFDDGFSRHVSTALESGGSFFSFLLCPFHTFLFFKSLS